MSDCVVDLCRDEGEWVFERAFLDFPDDGTIIAARGMVTSYIDILLIEGGGNFLALRERLVVEGDVDVGILSLLFPVYAFDCIPEIMGIGAVVEGFGVSPPFFFFEFGDFCLDVVIQIREERVRETRLR